MINYKVPQPLIASPLFCILSPALQNSFRNEQVNSVEHSDAVSWNMSGMSCQEDYNSCKGACMTRYEVLFEINTTRKNKLYKIQNYP